MKEQKAHDCIQKQKVWEQLRTIYHEHGGVDGSRSMKVSLGRKDLCPSALTVHKDMNKELGLTSIVRRKKPDYRKGTAHKVFENLLQQEVCTPAINQKWYTDFTYLLLTDGRKRYNCSVLGLHDRSMIASITDQNITADLAIRTVAKALESQTFIDGT